MEAEGRVQARELRLGVDLGGTKIEAVILDAQQRVVARSRRPTPTDGYTPVLEAVAELCLQVENTVELDARLPLGIGTPGSPSPSTGLMRNCNSTALNGRALRADLESHCERRVRMANDADCFALSECRDGAARAASPVFGVILGTGVGGGICVAGKLLGGPNAIAGEWGHNPLPPDCIQGLDKQLREPRLCYCGRSNCIETWLSGPGLALTHRRLHGADIKQQQLLAERPDAELASTLDLYCDQLAAALAGVVNLIDPQVIVLGGGLSNISGLYDLLPKRLAAQLFSDTCNTLIKPAKHGDSSGVRGAAWLWD